MADFGDDPFGDSVPAAPAQQTEDVPTDAVPPAILMQNLDEALPAAPPAAAAPIDLSDFDESVAAGIPNPEPTASDRAAHDVVQLSTAESQAAFIGGYTPHPVDAPPAIPPSPTTTDPRIQWRKKNQDQLVSKDKEEATAKAAGADRAKSHITKCNEDRAKQLQAKKATNRQAETASPESGVPKGTTWEKVNLLINFSRQDKAHTKDMSRMKACLQTCKALNVPVAIAAK